MNRFLSRFQTSQASGKEVFSWCLYDFANSAFATTILAVIFNRYFAGVIAGGEEGVEVSVLFWTVHLHGTALFNYIVAIAMFIVAVTSPVMGALADSLRKRKRFLGFYLVVGVISTAMLATCKAGDWKMASFWFILADIGFAGGNVFYNSFLRDLASQEESGKVSGWGWGIGYLGGGLLLILNLIMLQFPHLLGGSEGTFTVHHTFLTVSFWWFLFSLPLLMNIRERTVSPDEAVPFVNPFRKLKRTLSEIRKFRQLWKFLIAYLLFNDGIETVVIMAAIFGDQVLHMEQGLLIGYFLLIQFTAFIGSMLFGKITVRSGNKRTLMISLSIWCLVVISAFFIGWTGYAIQEYFVIGILAGLVMGASQSTARGMQAEFTPAARSAEFFGFFAVSGRFASLFGPLTYGTVVAITGSLRAGILSLIVFFIAGMILLSRVNADEGRRVARIEE